MIDERATFLTMAERYGMESLDDLNWGIMELRKLLGDLEPHEVCFEFVMDRNYLAICWVSVSSSQPPRLRFRHPSG